MYFDILLLNLMEYTPPRASRVVEGIERSSIVYSFMCVYVLVSVIRTVNVFMY